jgi:hypothetical protein
LAERCAKAIHDVVNGIVFENVVLISAAEAKPMRTHLEAIKEGADRMPVFSTKAKLRNYPYNKETLSEIFSHLKDLETIEHAQEHVQAFSALVSYLNQAKQYITQPEFVGEIDIAINRLGNIDLNDTSAIEASKRQLTQLKERYADWYIEQYKRYRINNLEEAERQRLLHSGELQVLKLAQESNYVAISPKLLPWLSDVDKLKPAEPISKQLIMSSVYLNFNPQEYKGVELPKLNDLKGRLNDIYDFADQKYHEIIQDENLLRNIDALNDEQKAFLEDFPSRRIELSNFPYLMRIIDRLSKGISRVKICQADIASVFSRQLTPDEAIREFNHLINSKLQGMDRSNVRISFE